jgi:hypothetical protein
MFGLTTARTACIAGSDGKVSVDDELSPEEQTRAAALEALFLAAFLERCEGDAATEEE